MNNNIAIILAGGQGTRFGAKKQFIELDGKPIWQHVYDKVNTIIPKENIVVVGMDIDGGKTRSYSVIKGLEYFKNKNKNYNKILIAEAARPLVTVEQIKTLLAVNSKSTTFVMPMVNTPIMRNGTYCDRNDFYELLTPQSFDFNMLYDAYQQEKNRDLTDETFVMYKIHNIKPCFVQGGQNLIKLTYLSDKTIIENLYKKQGEG